MLKRAKEGWDKLLASSALSAYGVAAFIIQPSSLQGTPAFFAALFNAEFVLAGTLLLLGVLLGNINLRILGFTLFIFNFFVIGAIVAFASGSVVSVLLFSIGFFGFSWLRDLLKTRKEFKETMRIMRDVL